MIHLGKELGLFPDFRRENGGGFCHTWSHHECKSAIVGHTPLTVGFPMVGGEKLQFTGCAPGIPFYFCPMDAGLPGI